MKNRTIRFPGQPFESLPKPPPWQGRRVVVSLPPEAQIQLPASELAKLQAQADSPPEVLSTGQASSHFGYTPKRWRQWCKDGSLPGAYLDENDRWRIPRSAAEAKISTATGGRGSSSLVNHG